MAIGAVRVMAAGKAGLESLPYFVDELLAQGFAQLEPWAIDHSPEQRENLQKATEELYRGAWRNSRNIFDIGASPPGIGMSADSAINRRLLQQINPLAARVTELADAPAQLGAWCRRQLRQYCRDTEGLWEKFKRDKGLNSSYQLAVVIPYCPEGPTSGTVGMYLGAALQRYFEEQGKRDQLVVWGIELCPPIYHDANDEDLDRTGANNAFRGYVARHEVLEGVPLSDDAADDERVPCFDINIAFDGGTVEIDRKLETLDKAYAAIDRAAAQMTACLLNGAAGGDRAEAIVQLKQGKRWHAFLAHVVSERSYSDACRYLRYRVTLPWFRNAAIWDEATVAQQKEALIRVLKDHNIRQLLANEPNPSVAAEVQRLVAKADNLDKISLAASLIGMLNGKNKVNLDQARTLLKTARIDDGKWYERSKVARDNITNIKAKMDFFCVNIELPENQRIEAAETARDNGIPGPIAGVVGDAGVAAVRQCLTDLINGVFRRRELVSQETNSEALFDEVMSISIGDWSRNSSNDAMRPSREVLRDFIAADRRAIPGAYSEMSFDLSKVVSPVEPEDAVQGDADHADSGDGQQQRARPRPRQPSALQWKLSDIDHEVPIEYSVLVLGRVRQGDGFKDVSKYGELEKNYQDLTANLQRWRELARYYGIKPPPELSEVEEGESPSSLGVNVQAAAVVVVQETA